MGEDGQRETKKLELDWSRLLPPKDDAPPAELVITATAEREDSPAGMGGGDEQERYIRSEFSSMTDRELDVAISKKQASYASLSGKLPDKGEKLLTMLKGLEAERERRKRVPKENNGWMELKQSEKPKFSGTSGSLRQDASSSVPPLQSSFARSLSQKLEENGSRTVDAFDKELSMMRTCDRRRNSKPLPRETCDKTLSVRKQAFQCPTKLSVGVNKKLRSNGDQRGGLHRPRSPCHSDVKVPPFSWKRKESQFPASRNFKSNKIRNMATVNLVDEEEPESFHSIDKADELKECLKDITIEYPSSDDHDSIEIRSSDLDNLKPEAYLSSTIMNFYIRYLQLSNSTEREICDYHFFNTYFYSKLVNRNDKDSSFVKFRKWWKSVSIFEKAYILIPIHEHLHWSLIIICIPDKKDDSGPLILHLDSLGLHSSRPIFDNVKSFLIEEWKYLDQGDSPTNHPFSDRTWRNLPRRIVEKTIPVPQQRNDYDCGLFVLFFIERFIVEAPQRLKRSDISMFNSRWFRPEEASNLRRKIRELITELLKASKEKHVPVEEPLPSEKCAPVEEPLPSVAAVRGEMMSQPIDC